MRILVVSNTCSLKKYNEIYEKRTHPMLDTNQKFFLSLIEGLRCIEDVIVDCVTSLPISYRCFQKRFLRSEEEIADGIFYHYCGCINLPIIRTLTVGYNIRVFVKRYLREHNNEKIVVLCDGLIGEANSLVTMLKKQCIPSVALVTDVPHIVSDMGRGDGLHSKMAEFYGKYTSKLLSDFDGYVFLTEQMNDICNPKNRPHMIMECIVTPLNIDAIPVEKLSDRFVALYAGKLHSDFGVLNLARAAAYLEDICEVWLYGGQGDCEEALRQLAKKHSNLKIHGIVTLPEIHKLERNANVLVNPRPNDKEFTKYSFPSKTAEYLMMNVPVIMYKLDGIPDEYDPYLYYVAENTPQSLADKIRAVLSEEVSKRALVSKLGRDYIIQNKNHLNQSRRMLEFVKDIGSEV